MSVIITEKEIIGFEESEKTFVVYEVAGRGQKGDKGDAGVEEGADFVTLNPALLVDPAYQEGRFFYDTIHKTLAMFTDIEGVLLQIGQEQWSRVVNKSGALIPNGSVCYVSGTLGHDPTVELALANNFNTSKIIGVATHDIVDNTEGIVTTFGHVHKLDTTGVDEGEEWLDGDMLWVSESNVGKMTKNPPSAPNLKIPIAIILNSHENQGILLVRAHFPTNLSAGDADGQIQFNNTGVLDTSTNFKFNKSTRLLDVTGFIRGTNEAYKYTDIGIADPTNHTLYWTNGRLQKITANADVEIAFGGWPESGWEGKIDVELIIGAGVNVTFHSAVQNPSDIILVEGSNKIYLSTNDSGANIYLTPDPIIGGVPTDGSEGDSIIQGPTAAFIILKNNLTAIVEPTVNDDSSAGYAVKSLWFDIATSKVYQCLSASIGVAIWVDLSQAGGGGLYEVVESRAMSGKLVELFDTGADDNILFLFDTLGLSADDFFAAALSIDGGLTYPVTHNETGHRVAEGSSSFLGTNFSAQTKIFLNTAQLKTDMNGELFLDQVANALRETHHHFDMRGLNNSGVWGRFKIGGPFKTTGIVDKTKFFATGGATIDTGTIHHLKRAI